MNEEELRRRIEHRASELADDLESRDCPMKAVNYLRNADPKDLSDPKNIYKIISDLLDKFKEDLEGFISKNNAWIDEYRASQQEGFQ
jgi:hypothetical protein